MRRIPWFAILAACWVGFAPSIRAAELVAYWDFERIDADNKIRSRVGSHAGAVMNRAVLSPGRPGAGRALDVSLSNKGYVELVAKGEANPMNKMAAEDSGTVMLWQKNFSNVASSSFWAASGSAVQSAPSTVKDVELRGWQFHLPWSSGVIYFDTMGCCSTNLQRLLKAPATSHNFSTWHHYAFVKDVTRKSIYIDGVLIATSIGALSLASDFDRLVIGADLKGVSPDALIDDLAIFKGALTADEVLSFAKGAPVLPLASDTDKDGMPDDWETRFGLNPGDPTDAPKDLDGDGASNLREFTLSTDPTVNANWLIKAYSAGSTPIRSLADADALVAKGSVLGSTYIMLADLADNAMGRFNINSLVPGLPTQVLNNNYVSRGTGYVLIPSSGPYTFAMNTDDGARLRVDSKDVIVNDLNQPTTDSQYVTLNLTAGAHAIEWTWFNGVGGGSGELFAAAGRFTSFGPAFKLVGAEPGLVVVQSPPPVPTRIIELTGSLNFGPVAVGESGQKTFVIGNVGNAPMTVSAITLPTGYTANWSTVVIAAGGSQSVTVIFSPTAVTTYTGSLTVTGDQTTGNNTLAVSGSGTAVPTRVLTFAGSLAFGDVTVGGSAQRTFTISNSGNTALSVSGITYPKGYTGNWPSGVIPAGGSQPVVITFAPTAVGASSGTVTVTADQTGGSNTLAISGAGIGGGNTGGTGASGPVARQVPASYQPGVKLSVKLAVTPASGTFAYAVEEHPPAGWIVADITQSGTADTASSSIKWGPFFDNTPRTLEYTLVPPSTASGTAGFSGVGSFDGSDSVIGGVTEITTAPVAVNKPPTVALTSPTIGQVGTAPASFAIEATAADVDGRVVKVEFYEGVSKIGEATAAPFKVLWSNTTPGAYQLTARATDDAGASTESAPVAVKVTSPTVGSTSQVVMRSANGSAGAVVQIPIELTAMGTENTIAFSVRFDPALLTYASFALSPVLVGGPSLVNTNSVTTGSLGTVLALAPGQTFSKGTNLLGTLQLQVVASAQGGTSTDIAFGDQPVFREVVSSEADILAAEFVSGKVSISAGYEADLAPRPNGDGRVSAADWTLIGRIVAGLANVSAGPEFQRADCAPRSTAGDGRLTSADWTQAGRYAAGVDAIKPSGGPTGPAAPANLVDGSSGSVSRVTKMSLSGRQVRVVAETIKPDSTVDVQVEVVALGNENALGFSLNFDSKALVYQNVSLAAGVGSVQLLPNTGSVGEGRLGILLGYPSGQSIAAGVDALLTITFQVKAEAPLPTGIRFGDAPVLREVVSGEADTLEAAWVDGAILGQEPMVGFRAPRTWEQSTPSSFSAGPARSEIDRRGGVFLSFGPNDWVDGQQIGAPIKLRESDGGIDTGFKPGIHGFSVNFVSVAPDGKVYVAQGRDDCDSVERLLPNGQRDPSFMPVAFSQGVRYLTFLPTGDVLVTVFGNLYTTPHPQALATPNPTFVRLKANGTVDPAFKTPEIGGSVPALFAPPVVDAQGRVYIGGSFTIGTTDKRVNIARLLPSGAVDLTFLGSASLTSPLTGTIRGIGFQKDGKVVAVGDIRLPERVAAIRFDVNGRRDLTFNSVLRTSIGASDYPRMAVIQADDKIVCAAGGLIRLNANGTVDSSFKRWVVPGGFLSWVTTLSDGRLLVPGVVAEGPNVFFADGTPAPTFMPHRFGVTQVPTSLALLTSERVAIAGGFNRLESQSQLGVAILDSLGKSVSQQPDLSRLYRGFTEQTFFGGSFSPPFTGEAIDDAFYFAASLHDTNQQPIFQSVSRVKGLVLDSGFNPVPSDVTSSDQIVSTGDGGLWVVHNGAQAALDRNWLLRLLPDGRRAPTFVGLPAALQAELGEVKRLPDGSVDAIRAGRLLILRGLPDGGVLASVNTVQATARIVRIQSTGQIDSKFVSPQVGGLSTSSNFSEINDPQSGATQVAVTSVDQAVFSGLAPLPDGRFVVCGNFTELSGQPSLGVALLQSNGSVDGSFVLPTPTYDLHPFTRVQMLAVETDPQGRIYLAGLFNQLDGQPASGLVRLLSSGAWDRSFVSPVELTDYPFPSAQLRIGGDQIFALGTFRDPAEPFPRPLWKISLASDDFSLSARLTSGGRAYLLLARQSGTPLSATDSGGYIFETSSDLNHWTPASGAVTVENGSLRFEPSTGGGEAARFYRALKR